MEYLDSYLYAYLAAEPIQDTEPNPHREAGFHTAGRYLEFVLHHLTEPIVQPRMDPRDRRPLDRCSRRCWSVMVY